MSSGHPSARSRSFARCRRLCTTFLSSVMPIRRRKRIRSRPRCFPLAVNTGALRKRLAALSPGLAAGFEVSNLDEVSRDMNALRAKLEREPA